MKRTILIVGFLIIVVVGGAIGWYLASPLFLNNVVDEEFVVARPAAQLAEIESSAPDAVLPEIPNASELAQMSEVEIQAKELELLEAAAAMPDKVMDDPMPEEVVAEPVAVARGMFQDADSFHQGSGSAILYQLPDGSHVLRLEDFEVTNGPDLHVLLVEQSNPTSREQVMNGYLDIGSLKGNIGNQNYDIPAGTDLSKYNSVVIYCMPFHVIFSTAGLE